MRTNCTSSRIPFTPAFTPARPPHRRLLRSVLLAAVAIGCSSGNDANTNGQSLADGSFDPSKWNSGGGGGGGGGGGAVQVPLTCTGNGVVDPGEQCDGPVNLTCATATMGARPNGTVTCTGCQIVSTGCTTAGPGAGGGTGTGGGIGTGGLGAAGAAGAAGATGGGGQGSGGTPVTTSRDPVIPAVNGTCPTFVTGTGVSIAGLTGIALQVGPKSQGTGSLVFYWHGTGSSASEYSRMGAAVVNEIKAQGGIIVSPQAGTGTGGDCSGTGIFSKDDFKAADQIVACAVRDHGIDPHRIYATGCSAGGLQSGCMAELRSSYLAAAAPNSGGVVFANALQDPTHVPALMTMHGGASDVVGVNFATTSATLDNQFKNAGGFVVNCNHGGGHCGAPGPLYASAWQFMKDHPFGVTPEPYSSSLPSSFPTYCTKF